MDSSPEHLCINIIVYSNINKREGVSTIKNDTSSL